MKVTRMLAGLALGTGLVASLSAGAGAATGWSRTPGSGVAGSVIRVASSSTTLCQWVQPASATTTSTPPAAAAEPSTTSTESSGVSAAAPGDPVATDGTSVELRFERDGIAVPLTTLRVAVGGAWAGRFTVPATDQVPAGDYDLLARCVIDRPELGGLRSFDFDPLPFTVAEGPPPTTVQIPTEIPPPITVTNPVQVQGTQVTRDPTTPTANQAAAVPTLPRTGDGTLGVGLAGGGALLVGAAALWWGARAARRAGRPDLLD
ncbi:MAG: hypothetical protein ACXVJX_18235 [Acidimicrobiia bacterium]